MDISPGSCGMFAAMFEKEKGALSSWTNEQNADFHAPSDSGNPILQDHKQLFSQIWLDK